MASQEWLRPAFAPEGITRLDVSDTKNEVVAKLEKSQCSVFHEGGSIEKLAEG